MKKEKIIEWFEKVSYKTAFSRELSLKNVFCGVYFNLNSPILGASIGFLSVNIDFICFSFTIGIIVYE